MTTYLKTKDHFFSEEAFDLLYDSRLDMLVTEPMPENLANYYHSESYISHSDQSKNLIDTLYLLVKKFSLSRKLALLNSFKLNNKSLLDIGAGTGDFLLAAKKQDYLITGVEPNTFARENARAKGIHLSGSLKQLNNQQYDVITLWHVLEHLPDLQEQLKLITALLSENGVLIIAVPNFKSYDAQHYKEHWAAYDVPRHLWHFSKTSIIKLFKPYGLDIKRIKPMWFDSFYVSLLSEKYKNKRNNYLRAFYHGLVSNMKGLSSKEYSSHIYILKRSNT